MGQFDTTARRAAKRNAVGFFGWVLPDLAPSLPVVGWLDARTAPSRPETELTCDALAEFLDKKKLEEPWMVVSEFQARPTADDMERALEYMFRFRRERRPEYDPRLKYCVYGVLVNLTGPKQADALQMVPPGMPKRGVNVFLTRFAVREKDPVKTLARIALGELNRCVLPWIALMNGADQLSVVEEWKRLADLEPDPQIRLQYAADALIFAELTGARPLWKHALEGWNVRVSQQVLEWQNEAEIKNQRANLLRALEKRCKTTVPSDLAELIGATQDMPLLLLWFDAALDVNTIDEFRTAMQSRP